jgi:isoquinoline 1-oxidoreductase subunit beta
MKRRAFLQSVLAGGSWWLGATAAAQSPATAAPAPGFSPWLRLASDGQVTAFTNTSDVGQGTWAALRAAVAEQLDVPLDAVKVEQAPLQEGFHNHWIKNYATFGSLGWRTGVQTLGPAAAAAREMLVQAAAEHWQVPAAECHARDAAVYQGGRSLPYTELLADAAKLTPPDKPHLKPRAEWRLLGKDLAQPQAAERVQGRMVYGIDVQRPRMLYAAVVRAPAIGGRLAGVDAAPARKIKGVHEVVRLPTAVAVIADDTWTAMRAVASLAPRWADDPAGPWSSEQFRSDLLAATQSGEGQPFPASFDPRLAADRTQAALDDAAQWIDASFDVPFLAHMAMEPLNATVEVQADQASVWVSTQSQLDTQQAVAQALGLGVERVALHSLPCGGGFGRRLEHDWVVEAALIARAMPGRPVKTTWSREAELRAGRFRPAAAARVRIALAADGAVTAVRADLANPSLLEHSGLRNGPKAESDWTATMGWLRQPYDIPAMHLTWTRQDRGLPCGYWRSVGASQNSFFFECALDLAARRSAQDPLALRRRLLAKDARALAFVEQLAAAAQWGQPLPAGHARGIAIGSANGSISGHVVELAVTAPGRFKLLRITAAIDAGWVADPKTVEGQMMGGTVFGLGAALHGEIMVKDGRIEQRNFDGYPVATMAQVPPMQVLVISGGNRAGGVGEEGVPTIAPAIANALLAASGQAVSRLPLTRAGWTLDA